MKKRRQKEDIEYRGSKWIDNIMYFEFLQRIRSTRGNTTTNHLVIIKC